MSRLALRKRARELLCLACTDGRLDNALGQLESFVDGIDAFTVNEASIMTVTVIGDDSSPLSGSETDDMSRQRSSSSLPEKKKKKDHGRGIMDALNLGAVKEASQENMYQKAEKLQALNEDDEEWKPPEDTELDPAERERRLEEWKAKKFEAAKREAERREKAQQLYLQRVAFCDAKLKPLLEKLVAEVSKSTPPGRPANPVPMMIELLAEYCGRSIKSFKNNTPENRLKKEIAELEREVARMEELVDQPYVEEWETDPEDDGEDGDSEDTEVEVVVMKREKVEVQLSATEVILKSGE